MTPSSRKILILGRPKSGKLSLVKALTSSLPSGLVHETTPHAGLTHTINLTTRYYSTEAGIWIDEIPEDTEAWLNEYLSEEATPVLQSLAAVILTVNPATSKPEDEIVIIKKLNERGEDIEWDGTCIIVGKQTSENSISDIASLCDDQALEYIDLNQSGENEYGGLPLRYISDNRKTGQSKSPRSPPHLRLDLSHHRNRLPRLPPRPRTRLRT
jgi:hypothetical protein